MPHDPRSYGAAPPPGRATSDPYGDADAAPAPHGSGPSPGRPGPAPESHGSGRGPVPYASGPGPATSAPPSDEPWHPIAVAADHAHPRAAPGVGRFAPPWAWSRLRVTVGRVLHGAVRIGRWAVAGTVVAFVAAVVLFSRITSWDTTVPLDGTPVAVEVDRGQELWVWAPEDRFALTCSAWDADGLSMRPRILLRNPVSDDHRAMFAVPTGSTGAVEISCSPNPDAEASGFTAPSAEDSVRVSGAPPGWEVQGYYALVTIGLLGFLWAAVFTAVLWIAWGILRATNVLPWLRPDGRRPDGRRSRRRQGRRQRGRT